MNDGPASNSGGPQHGEGRHRLVPPAVATYALLSMLDYGFSIMAFRMGYVEANPLLAWYQSRGLFEAAKVFSIVAVVLIGVLFWRIRIIRAVIYAANLLMLLVFGYHLYFWFRMVIEQS